MMQRVATIWAIGLLCAICARISLDYSERGALRSLAEGYVTQAPQQRATPNVVTGILLTYRAFDTLGEVAVLFMVAAGVGLVLTRGRKDPDPVVAQASPAS